jgi:hypothetical protein
MPPQAPSPLIRPIQPSFSSGELSPQLYSRVDLAKYATGLRRCRNFIVQVHGGAYNRPGTKFVALTKFQDKLARVIRFVFNQAQAYIFEFGDHYIRFYQDGAPILADAPTSTLYNSGTGYVVNDIVTYNQVVYQCIQNGTNKQPDTHPTYWEILLGAAPLYDSGTAYVVGNFVTYGGGIYYCIQNGTGNQPDISPTYWVAQNVYEVPTPYAYTDLPQLRFESSADVVYICQPNFQQMTLSRFGNAYWKLDLYSSDDGPFMTQNITATTIAPSAVSGSGITLTSSTPIFNALQVGGLFLLQHYVPGQSYTGALSAPGTGTAIPCFTTWRVISHGTWTGAFQIEKSTDGGTTWTMLRAFSSVNDFNGDTFGTEDVLTNTTPFLIRINATALSSGTLNVDLSSDPYYQFGVARITAYTSTTVVTADVLSPFGLTSATTQWAEGSWSNYRGWPSVARFFQDRLCFSGTRSEPMQNWLSVTGNYVSFLRHTTLLDTDGITIPLPTRQLNAINGLITLRKLLAFTSASEWTIGPPTGNTLTPLSVEQLVQGYRGSFGVDPAIVGFECIFVQANSKVIRNLQYQLYFDLYTGADLNILSRHLFQKNSIIEMAYQQDPDSVVWCLRDDGVLLGMTYLAEQEVIAWHWHDTGGFYGNPKGVIESIATIPGQGYDELWMEVQRGDIRCIERMSERIITSDCADGSRHIRLDDQYFVDCGVTFGDQQVLITGISNTNPVVVTAPNHGFTNGTLIRIDNVSGMTELNGHEYRVENVTTNTFELWTP